MALRRTERGAAAPNTCKLRSASPAGSRRSHPVCLDRGAAAIKEMEDHPKPTTCAGRLGAPFATETSADRVGTLMGTRGRPGQHAQPGGARGLHAPGRLPHARCAVMKKTSKDGSYTVDRLCVSYAYAARLNSMLLYAATGRASW